jgi:hypothetical protein
MAIWKVGVNLVNFSRFGILYREKSGNPATNWQSFLVGRAVVGRRLQENGVLSPASKSDAGRPGTDVAILK